MVSDLGNVSVPRSIFLALVRYFTVDDFAQKLQANVSTTAKSTIPTKKPPTQEPVGDINLIRFNDSVATDQFVTLPKELETMDFDIPPNGNYFNIIHQNYKYSKIPNPFFNQ